MLEDDGGPVRPDELSGWPLDTAHQGLREPRREVGVLAEALLRAAPARIAHQVECGHQRDVTAARPQLRGGERGGLLVQVRVPGGADRQVDREQRAVQRLETVRHLLDQQDGNPEPGGLHDVPLHGVGDTRPVRRTDARGRGDARPGVCPLQSVEGSHSVEGGHLGAERVGQVVARGVAFVRVPAVHPLVDLSHFLGERHP